MQVFIKIFIVSFNRPLSKLTYDEQMQEVYAAQSRSYT
ncbi:hypothetical protein Sarmat_00204 [Rickettsiales endosymbiont of Paramecium tredecaurelia]|nr:hypothetical protein [Candidatus Sarmatiella mevalonica]